MHCYFTGLKKTSLLAITLFGSIFFASSASLAFDRTRTYWVQGDLGGGFQRIEPDAISEIPKSGILLGGRILGEYRDDTWGAFGLGLGMQQTWQDGETEVREQQYILRAAVVDGSYLYPIGSKWLWIGWLVRTQSGKGGLFDFSDIESFQTLITTGPQVRLNFATEHWDWVIGASALTALNSSSRKIYNVPVYVGLSIPLGAGEPKSTPIAATAPPAEPPPVEPQVAVEFDASLISFDLNKATLRPEAKIFLTKLSQILKDQNDNWQTVVVSGHTDQSGSAERNRILSVGRANAVMNWLVQEGIPFERMSAIGYGPEKLLPGVPPNSEKHRRVEMLFKGVLNGVKIDDAMSALKTGN